MAKDLAWKIYRNFCLYHWLSWPCNFANSWYFFLLRWLRTQVPQLLLFSSFFKALHMGRNPRKCYLPPNCGVLGVVGLHVITHGGTPLPHPSLVTLLIVQEKLVSFKLSQLSDWILQSCLSFRLLAGNSEDKTTEKNLGIQWIKKIGLKPMVEVESSMSVACHM